jgi:hypothetical protein
MVRLRHEKEKSHVILETTKALDLCMLKPKSNALRVVEATPGRVTEVKKPVSKCIST